jgi:hypothetical protein
MAQQFVYHLVPEQIHGNMLYPLNRLREVAPLIAEAAYQKYEGREALLKTRIPPLNCLWNDVLMFCPVHPRHIMQTFREEGYNLKPRRWFEAPVSRFEPECTAVFFSKVRPYGDSAMPDNAFSMLSDVTFESLTQLPDALRQHIRLARAENRQPFMFVGVPHILYRGVLKLDGIEVVAF